MLYETPSYGQYIDEIVYIIVVLLTDIEVVDGTTASARRASKSYTYYVPSACMLLGCAIDDCYGVLISEMNGWMQTRLSGRDGMQRAVGTKQGQMNTSKESIRKNIGIRPKITNYALRVTVFCIYIYIYLVG